MRFEANMIKKLVRDESGNMTVFSVFMVVLVLMITGASVDIMRFEAVRAKMQSTMDRAVLAAADLDQQQDSVAVVEDYMEKAGIIDVLADVQVTETIASRTVTATGTAEMDTIFLNMSGFDSMTAPSLSAAEERISNVEISLVLDISASMSVNDRMTRLRPAAQEFVTKVMTEDSNGVTTLNLVPFAGHVNPGTTFFEYLQGERPDIPEEEEEEVVVAADYFPPWGQAISNVVFYFDRNGDGVYDRAHKIESFPENAPRDADEFYKGAVAALVNADWRLSSTTQFLGASIKGGNQTTRYFQVKGDQNGPDPDIGPLKNRGRIPGYTYSYNLSAFQTWEDSYVSPNGDEDSGSSSSSTSSQNVNMPSSCVEIAGDEFATTSMPSGSDYVPHFIMWWIDLEIMDWGWCPGEDTTIQYYSDDKDALIDFIGDMRMHDGTGLHYAMKYGLALLDPANRDDVSYMIQEGLVDARFEGRPIDWGDPETEKFVVLMTDGQVTGQYRPTNPTAAVNNETGLYYQYGSPYYTYSSQDQNRAYLQQQCDLAKSLGVTVFTIAFETNTTGANDMYNCASSPSHFFHVQGNDIAMAFDTVARQINNLRLIQ